MALKLVWRRRERYYVDIEGNVEDQMEDTAPIESPREANINSTAIPSAPKYP